MSLTLNPGRRSDHHAELNARVGYRINEWAKKTGTSRATTYRRIADGTLETIDYGGVTLITGLAGAPSKSA
jgi:hypothetical protein